MLNQLEEAYVLVLIRSGVTGWLLRKHCVLLILYSCLYPCVPLICQGNCPNCFITLLFMHQRANVDMATCAIAKTVQWLQGIAPKCIMEDLKRGKPAKSLGKFYQYLTHPTWENDQYKYAIIQSSLDVKLIDFLVNSRRWLPYLLSYFLTCCVKCNVSRPCS